MMRVYFFIRSEFILPPLRSFLLLPFQANVSCVGYQRESTQLRFLKGVVVSVTLYTAFGLPYTGPPYITGH